jgi:hypothetical protein
MMAEIPDFGSLSNSELILATDPPVLTAHEAISKLGIGKYQVLNISALVLVYTALGVFEYGLIFLESESRGFYNWQQ